jgi:hypothetical protein
MQTVGLSSKNEHNFIILKVNTDIEENVSFKISEHRVMALVLTLHLEEKGEEGRRQLKRLGRDYSLNMFVVPNYGV